MSFFSPASTPLFFKHSNLQNLISSVTPTVWPQAFKQKDGDTMEYFTLGDLWDCYEEWSAYGVGVPILLNNGESVTQYYAPYLSAMQIYTNKPQQTSQNLKENEDVASVEGQRRCKTSHNPSLEAESHAHLYFNFCETCSPYWRIPFAEKIAELAEVHPGLFTLKNIDLSPASWISVAWYPIYQIPTKDRLSTCFLTYHTLSPSSQEKGKKSLELVKGEEGNFDKSGEALYTFGMATYRLDDEIWINSHTYDDYEKIIDLYNAAESWLKKLSFWHHDFNFFTSQFGMEGLFM